MLEYLRSFAYIEAIERTGSIRNAARMLYITASALDRRLQELEHELGAQIFERHPRGMRVTPAGEIFLHHMRAHRADSERMRLELDRLKGLRLGQVRIAASQATANHLLPMAIQAFQHRHPGVSFDVRVSTHVAIIEMLRRFEADIALVYGRPEQEDLGTLLEVPQTLHALMRSNHALGSRRSVTLADCLVYPLALPGSQLALRSLLGAELARQPSRPNIALESDSLELLRRFVRRSDAITFQVTAGIAPDDSDIGLTALPVAQTTLPTPPLCIVQQRDRTLPHAAAAFCEALAEALSEWHEQALVPVSEYRD